MKKKPLITVIIPLKNTKEHHRGTTCLEGCLQSLGGQSIPGEQIEIIVADLDSDSYYKTKHKKICGKFKTRYIYTKTDDAWNISRARNIGIRNAKADYVMTTDVDCIFAPDFIETVLKHVAEDRIIHCRISDLPGNYDGKLDNFFWMNKVSVLRPPFGYGGCQAFSKKWAFKVRGFDEDYIVWGADDTDFYLRAIQDGLKSIWIEKEASFFHQYHETENNEENRAYVHANRLRLKMTEMGTLPIIRNDSGWGGEKPKVISQIKTNSKLKDTAILITTFMRDVALFRCVKSVKEYYPDITIFVADNGKPNAKKDRFCKEHKCSLVTSPFDSGVGSARNAVFSILPKQYKYVVICEDDALFTGETKLKNWIAILEAEKDIGIVGGGLKKQGAKTLIPQNYEGWLYAKATTFCVERVDAFDWKVVAGIRYALCDIVINIFMMKRELWNSQKWDPNIKTWPEHEDFFFSLKKKTDWKVAYTDTVSLIHKPMPHDHKYAAYRSRLDGLEIFGKKWGIEYIWNSWHKDWGKPNPMRIGVPLPKQLIPKPTSEKKDNIAIGIKTFLREENFFRAVQAIRENFPYPYRLYIADDGYLSPEKKGRYNELEGQEHKIMQLPFNVGISAGRNQIIKNAKEDYVLIMDDDIRIDSPKSIKNMKKVLDAEDDLGVVAGTLFQEINGKPFGNDNYTHRGLTFTFDRSLLIRDTSHCPIKEVDGIKYCYADQVVNFFLAKRDIFEEVKWDNRIKVEWEHIDFFLSLKKTSWKVAVCLDAKATHLYDRERDLEYNQHRRSGSFHYFSQKHNITKIVNRWG